MTAFPLDFDMLTRLGAVSNSFEAGEKVFLEDDTGSGMYLVRSGRIDIITYGTVLENVRAGGIFGEMALIDDGPRSAAAIATEASEVISIDKPTFLALICEQPEFALHVMRLLTARLRKMNLHL
jgi:CRP/FNR family transcriptional regulator, cyclic AMP receptor protein